MAPKRRLPRLTQAADGQPNLEDAAAERIDAVTAEPLHATKYVEILSPDGTLRLFYNTATLVRIATDRGMFMQPPHFREIMVPSLQRQVEEIEGRTFHFEKRNVLLHNATDGGDGGLHVLHRHVYFDQIMDEFYLLNPAELYVCPACYLHWVSTRFLPHLTATRQRVEYVNDDPNPVIDPLDVLAHMQGVEGATGAGDADENASRESSAEPERVPMTIPSMDAQPDWDSPLVHIVFRRAVSWKRHVRRHHNETHTAAVDYRLKEFLSQYISQYNRLAEEKYRKRRHDGNTAAARGPTLTVTRYWHINARYNRLRYNRIVEAVERAEPHIDDCVERMTFTNEEVMNTFHPNDKDTSGSDFICDSDSSSCASSYGGFPRYEGSLSSRDADDAGEPAKSRKRRRTPSSTSSSSSSSEDGDDDEEEEEEEEEEEADGFDTKRQEQQRKLYKSGLLAPLPGPYRDLSYEERCVLEAHSRRVIKPTALYVPPQADDASDERGNEEVDWSQIGGTIEGAEGYVRDIQQRQSTVAPKRAVRRKEELTRLREGEARGTRPPCHGEPEARAAISVAHSSLMLDDDSVRPVVTTTRDTLPTKKQQLLLLDDSE
ncbi:hypothetical protein DQ04_00691160 [Trypanosoma grayi]|uniref:hypothetical protein n=1 Tax=Trypanosoma grayi TaxID=71804 RepID=UPI0004F4AA36|nr:hypothetical protein DQ04_00691160 [Trypanosoma grayi]KEG13970.1 hypothetical protein DQ04_00691160 [Trypanosoma grayi]